MIGRRARLSHRNDPPGMRSLYALKDYIADEIKINVLTKDLVKTVPKLDYTEVTQGKETEKRTNAVHSEHLIP